ncbi:pectin lyase fold/virulence factor [Armillaria luteobubalina]|uniref:Pectinesterase n=1 Tax=Armillaria luteobubalina TaxID=153913 RepID=A0AA39Q2C1_9AGAR|nr:pectin lyase fold/virulence factor [Armillaria luteobubalina]
MVFFPLRAFTLFSLLTLFATTVVNGTPAVKRDSRTSAPSGAVVVRGAEQSQGNTARDGTAKVIFIYAGKSIFLVRVGTYSEQVYIDRKGKTTIMGQTSDTSSYTGNTVTITHSSSLGTAGTDDLTGTLRVHKDDFALYNVNVKNTFGQASTNGQALALSAYGSNQGYYGVGFYSYQDTVLAETGNQFYGSCYIEGAVDYIFGQYARAYFHKNMIASVGAGAITASGRTASSGTSGTSLFVINKATITTSSAATTSLQGKVYLGRPWGNYARVVYTSCSLGNLINGAGWEQWSTSSPNTDHVTFAEYASTGSGASGTRASFSTKLSSTSGYTISDVLGSTYTSWVDSSYL